MTLSRESRTRLPTTPSDSAYKGASEAISEEASNRRLRQAINYLTQESPATSKRFESRLNSIAEYIVQEYAQEGYPYDPHLYNQVKRLVEEHQEALGYGQSITKEYDLEYDAARPLYRSHDSLGGDPSPERRAFEAAMNAYNSASSQQAGNTLMSAYAAYAASAIDKADPKNLQEIFGYDKLPKNIKEKMEKERARVKKLLYDVETPATSHAPPALNSETVEHVWEYGGPHNPPEVWHKGWAPVLPFGETIDLANYDNAIITNDLAEFAKRKKNTREKSKAKNQKDDGPIETETHFNVARRKWTDSGSSFSLPSKMNPDLLQLFSEVKQHMTFSQFVEQFNIVSAEEQEKKEFVARKLLTKFRIPGQERPLKRTASATGIQATSSEPLAKRRQLQQPQGNQGGRSERQPAVSGWSPGLRRKHLFTRDQIIVGPKQTRSTGSTQETSPDTPASLPWNRQTRYGGQKRQVVVGGDGEMAETPDKTGKRVSFAEGSPGGPTSRAAKRGRGNKRGRPGGRARGTRKR